ncbi:MAG: ABC transporter permease, partial [Clostridia bacterium]|nr:ABC transporter permease [Clostridia bacterium]
MSVAAISHMYAAVLTHVPEYATWGSMISSIATFKEVPNNYDYVMSQYDVVAVDKNGEAVTTGYTEEDLREYFNSKETLIMVLDNYKIDDLTLAQYGYFTEDEFLDYAYKGIDSEKEVTLVGSDGFPYTKFVGDTSKKFTYYTNDSVYNKAVYNAKPQYSDDAIRQMMSIAGGNAQLAEAIIAARNAGDAQLRTFLTQMFTAQGGDAGQEEVQANVEKYFQMFRLPSADETTEGYIANAYTTAYTVKDNGENIDLPAFADKAAYNDRVDLGVKLILQKKESVSYGCLDSGFYYTNALTKYILEKEAESEIVKYIEENGELESLPMYVDYYYVKAEEEGGKEYYILDTVSAAIETGGSAMSEMIGSITGSKSSGITAAMLGGSNLPSSIRIYPLDFDTKKAVTRYLDKWNKMCENGETYTYVDADGAEHSVQLEVKDKITYTDSVGMIIGMVNTMIQMITIALVAFTALSLVVSTVMIGIITYVSVVERVKEIGILRAVGARKKDIKRLFNSETFIIGLVAGVFGILITYLLSLIINIIVMSLAGFWGIA